MAEQGREYDQYAPQTNGRLFSNSMFGFNKEEVLEYLEELADENYQRQASADAHIQELTAQIQSLEASAQRSHPTISDEEIESLRRKVAGLSSELDVTKTASQQAEGELHDFKEQLYTAQRENEWLREEYQKSDKQMAELRRQLDEASQGQWHGAEEQITELRRQLAEVEAERDAAEAERDAAEAERDAAEAERDAYYEGAGEGVENPAAQAAGYIIAEANDEADRIRAAAIADRDRIHRQILTSASGLAGSITTLREDISSVEGDVSSVLESVQEALADLMVALGRTEQNLNTLGVAVDRFPATSPVVSKGQPVVYFQPSAQLPTEQQEEAPQPVVSRPTRAAASPAAKKASPPQSYGSSDFKRVWPDSQSGGGKTRPFRPTYSNSPTANSAYFPQTAEVLPTPAEEKEERMRQLSETLVDTLMQMMN